ncbi:Glucose-1-phosphate adenylyltransferase small subunit 1 [Morus notabilis]|uniref:Glucose-1-phosphate adenylyltransferase small subunit 1 n=1 Tax=Morus notabilis TaxID=981085 RepID=W9S454_9ROSA|nr:Glucose-1-phosphate adenylyltransferase small subunit 1 [Morus notabilis]
MVTSQLCLPSHTIPSCHLTLLTSERVRRNKTLPFKKLHSSLFQSNSHQQHTTTDQSVAAIIFGDGSDSKSQLYPLTKRRSEGAIPIAANYRLIDAVVSNCINSNIYNIYALTQFNSTSLNSHLCKAYSGMGLRRDGLLQVIAAYQSPDHHNRWFQGSADAVRKCLWAMEEHPVREFLVLPGHHLYRMDYRQLISAHRNANADITIAASTAAAATHDPSFGFLEFDSSNKVLAFRFNSEVSKFRNCGSHGSASMGIYLINKDVMKRLLEDYFPNANDFTSEVIPGAVSVGMKVQAYVFGGYWEDMRSIGAFYRANMETTKEDNMGYNFFDRVMPVYTMPRCLPPTLISDALITDSLIGDGCIIGRCSVRSAVIGMRTRIGDGVVIEDSVIFGSDIYESEEDIVEVERIMRNGDEERKQRDMIPIGIGQHTRIRKAIVDKNARIGKNVMIINKDKVEEGEAKCYVIREGIVVLLRGAVIPDATIL